MTQEQYEPKVGDRVQWNPNTKTVWSSRIYRTGTVTKIGACVTVTVDYEQAPNDKYIARPSRYGRRWKIEPISAELDAFETWCASQPKTERVYIARPRNPNEATGEMSYGRRDVETTPEDLRHTADELVALAAWLERRPRT